MNPAIYLKKNKEASLQRRHPWVFSGAVQNITPGVKSGQIVDVIGQDGFFLGRGHYQHGGSIVVRMLTFTDEIINSDFWAKTLQKAYAYRSALGINKESVTNAYYEEKASKLMQGYIRKGVNEMEIKALSSDSEADGGLLITPEMSSEVVKKIYETSPMRQYASVQTISTSSLEILEDLDEAGAGWVGETEERGETSTPQFKMVEIPVHEMFAQPQATQRFLDDAAINIEAWLAEKVADKFARTENASFVSGDGVKKAKGFLSYAAGTSFGQIEQIASGNASALTGDSFIELIYSLKTAYKPASKFFMNRAVIKAARLLKDLEGRYLWAPGLDGNTSGSILGYEIVEFADMPVVQANALAVAFGDMKQAYQIVDRIGIRTLRDPFTSKPYIKFYTTKRVGGGVKNFEALKLMKISV